MKNMLACEGFFIETYDGLIFDVKGHIHPENKIISFIRYFPAIDGNRKRNGVKYKKVYSISDRTEILRKIHPEYLFYDPILDTNLQGVLNKDIKYIYNPVNFRLTLKKKQNLTSLQKSALNFTDILINSTNCDENKIGISGSLMVDLETKNSDIDIIIYGAKNVRMVYDNMSKIFSDKNDINRYSIDQYKKLYKFKRKDTKISWKDFIKIESRKLFQGIFKGIDFYIRGIKDWDEIEYSYGDFKIKNYGYATIKGRIKNNSESIFTPCIYKTYETEILTKNFPDLQIDEIFSYRGRFSELLNEGESFIAHGKIEKVITNTKSSYYRLIVGSSKNDYLKLVD
ncbi:MAG: hypothetical protein ACTSXT_07660 [Candidatus Helarchaeota archaeon]